MIRITHAHVTDTTGRGGPEIPDPLINNFCCCCTLCVHAISAGGGHKKKVSAPPADHSSSCQHHTERRRAAWIIVPHDVCMHPHRRTNWSASSLTTLLHRESENTVIHLKQAVKAYTTLHPVYVCSSPRRTKKCHHANSIVYDTTIIKLFFSLDTAYDNNSTLVLVSYYRVVYIRMHREIPQAFSCP